MYHNVVPPEDFYSLVPQGMLEDRYIDTSPLDDGAWRDLVTKLRSEGPDALTPDEWRAVALVSWNALIVQQNTTK
ncbi:MAG TPA: hypothetical protein VM013_05410, partial [Dehalococcoidia bacterium]|nr:hypothetical protein [Dehalococcoidia bacterium]